ncbi:unnamed protein product [Dibothriocephalus latus]|uniref:Uncharacterized protein n=1 Tax=Dibothriocephalus latus TaxID=60516 RepID=A0A3P6RZE8_DIBLA|nr:unnamed protein product [Dibothriocephalus latus]
MFCLLSFEPELDAIGEVTDEVQREEEMNYSTESENEVEEKGAEENENEENREDERDVETSCDALLEEAGEKSKDEASLSHLHFDVEDAVQTPILATRVTESNVDKLTQTTLNSAEELKTQLFSSRRRRPSRNWKDVLQFSGELILPQIACQLSILLPIVVTTCTRIATSHFINVNYFRIQYAPGSEVT